MVDGQSIIPAERIEQAIISLRGQRVMLDADLARLYGVETRVLGPSGQNVKLKGFLGISCFSYRRPNLVT